MLIKRVSRLCALLVLSGLSSVSFSQELRRDQAIFMIDINGHAIIDETYSSIEDGAFANTGVKFVSLPNSITTIPSNAFKNTTYLETIELPSGLISIESSAFKGTGIRSINLPEGITTIGDGAFANSNLEVINFPSSVTSIGLEAFANTRLKHIKIPDYTALNKGAFAWVPLQSIEIGKNVSMSDAVFFDSLSDVHTAFINQNIYGRRYYSGGNYGVHVSGTYNGYFTGSYFEFNDLALKLLVFGSEVTSIRNDQGTSYCSNEMYGGGETKLVFKSNLTGSSCGINRGLVHLFASSVDTASYVSSEAVISPCANLDSDSDGHQDCYDQFPNDPDRWFNYSDESNDVPQNPSNDSDGDGVLDVFDQFSYGTYAEYNALDSDGDGIPNRGDNDDDNDGLLDVYETGFPFNYDISVDGLLSELQLGTNPLNPDSDFDGTLDGLDAFPLDNTESLDTDSDGIGNNADTDDDNDGYTDFLDAFPTDATEWADSDLDGIGNNSDPDDDNDGVADTEDAFPHTASESLDSDNDGVGDNADAFPDDATEVADTDSDGIGNNADPDDDNDGVADADDGDPLNADIGIQPSQLISVAGNPVGVNGHSTRISLSYDTSDGNNQLPGVGFRIHFNSEMLTYNQDPNNCMNGYDHDEGHEEEDDHGFDFHGFCGFEYGSEGDEEHGHEEEHDGEEEHNLRYLYNSLVVNGDGPYQDFSDYDNDSSTDKFIIFGWAALGGDFPNVSLPTGLLDVVFNVSWDAFDQASITTPINFSKVSTTEGYNFDATNYTLNVLPATWDFDGNGQADALTDGLILLRHAFGVRGASLTDSVMATDSTMTPEEVQVAVEKALVIADIDGSGSVDALTDGLILLRYMFGLTGETLMDSVVSANATRASVESIQQYIELYMPNDLLLPVQSEPSFIVGDWKLEKIPEIKENYPYDGLSNWGPLPSWRGFDQTVFDTCVADDIYRFGINGSFEYLLNGSTFMDYELNPSDSLGGCFSPPAPWNENDVYSFSIDEDSNLLTVIGTGAYVGLSNVANGTDDIQNPSEAPESITYTYNLISDNNLILEVDAWHGIYRYTLERVIDN